MDLATAIISIAEEPEVANIYLDDSQGKPLDMRPVFAPLGSDVVDDSDIAAAINDMVSLAIFRGHRSILITWADAPWVVQ